VNWTVIKPDKLKGTVWDKIDDKGIEYDKKFLEENYSKAVSNTSANTSSIGKA